MRDRVGAGEELQVSAPEISQTLEQLLQARGLTFSSAERLAHALESYNKGRGGFADYLIREHARARGCEAVATFEKKLIKEPDFVAP